MSLSLGSIRTDSAIEIGLGIFVAGVTLATSYLWRDLWVECIRLISPKDNQQKEKTKLQVMFLSAISGTITATILCVSIVTVLLWIDKHKFSSEASPHPT